MAKFVDHFKRRQMILQKSLGLFASAGYSDVTYQLIATHCGLQRTTLYKYFQSKREIFEGVIVLIVDDLMNDMQKAIGSESKLNYAERLTKVMVNVLDMLAQRTAMMRVIDEYLVEQRRNGEDVTRKMRRHTIGGYRMIIHLVYDGIVKGEFGPVNPRMAGDILYGMLEAAAFRLVIIGAGNLDKLKESCRLAVSHLVKRQ